MKKSTVISNPYRNLIKIADINKSAITSSLIIVVGIISGALLYSIRGESLAGELLESFLGFVTDFSHKSKPEIISGLMLPDIIYLLAMIMLGTCAFGTPAVMVISAIYSMGLSMTVAYIYDSFALQGIEYCLLIFLPGKFLLVLAILLLTQNCFVTSNGIRLAVYGKTSNDRVVDLKKYSVRNFVIFIIILLSGFIDFLMLTSFSSLFEFD